MSNLRDHQPITIDKFNGLWSRGDNDNCPIDHFQDCENIQFVGDSSFRTRPGIDIHQSVAVPISNIKRIYNYPTPEGNTLIVLAYDDATDMGSIYHVVDATTVHGPLLTLASMIDFGFVPYAGRGYITPIGYFTAGDLNVEKGLENEFLYVYLGDGTAARKAAGNPLSGVFTIANGAAGHTDPGFHLFAWVAETDSGFLTAPGDIVGFTTAGGNSVSFGSVPVGGASVTKRHLVATKVITGYTGNTTGYQFFFVPNATINDNTTLFLNNVSFFDADLLEDASYLLDNYSEIPAGVGLTFYHNRLCLYTTFDDISIILVSTEGEPEAINQVDGLIIVPLDGNPITNAQELRDVFYVFKRSKTFGYVDNGDVPSSWPFTIIDNALGTCIHGIATVIDSGSASVDFLIVCTYQGISLFSGKYITPELSWKIENFWGNQDRNEFRKIQILNSSIQKSLYIIIPDRRILVGNYSVGMDPRKIKWAPWSFFMGVNTIAVVNIDEIIVGADLV